MHNINWFGVGMIAATAISAAFLIWTFNRKHYSVYTNGDVFEVRWRHEWGGSEGTRNAPSHIEALALLKEIRAEHVVQKRLRTWRKVDNLHA